MALAENVQVLEPSGAEFSTDAPQLVLSILRSAVSQTGNTPVESSAEIQLRTTLSTMGSSIVVVVEQVKNGVVVGSGRQKTPTVDDLDMAIDDAVKAVTEILSLRCERKVLERQRTLVTEELTTTSQRVNLFEKVKIPTCKENIRIIKIAIGDEQTAAVTRGKIAKSRVPEASADGEVAA
jgi:H(+)-transporting ATP synthase subunit D